MGQFPMERTRNVPDAAKLNGDDILELAKRAGTGDVAATARLLRLVAPEMLRVVRGVMGTYAAEVDDAAQQALVGLVQALPAFRGDCSPVGYACRIAFRTALAQRRSAQKSRARRDPSVDADSLPSDMTARADAAHRTELLRGLLEVIPAEQAEALAMRTMLGWSLQEIASASGAPLNTVRSRLRLAKEALRSKIEADPSLADALGVAPCE
jgi:RNA polymerase sigma-70 factor (ECF subfamily)